MHSGVQGQLRPGQEQRKQALVGLGRRATKRRATKQTGPQGRHQQEEKEEAAATNRKPHQRAIRPASSAR